MAQRTLTDYTTPDLDTPAGRLRNLIQNPDNPDAYDYPFGQDFVHRRSPIGIKDAKQTDDPDLLREYRDLCHDELPGDYFAEAPMIRDVADDKYATIDALDAMITEAEFPPKSEWPVDPDFVDWVRTLDRPEKGDYQFERQAWERVWDACTPEQLQFIRDACRYAYGASGRTYSAVDDVLATMLYYHDEVAVDTLVDVNNRGNGPSPTRLHQNVAGVLDRLDPVIGALLIDWINPEIRTNVTETSGNGNYKRSTKRINIGSDSNLQRLSGGVRNTTAHELAHALHDLYGFFVNGGDSVDNRDKDPDDWEWNVYTREHDQLTTAQASFHAVVRQEWEKLQRGTIDPTREYQTKNADEFICCAFECWVVNPDRLADIQPRMKQLFDAHFGNQDYETKQLRLEMMPSPVRNQSSGDSTTATPLEAV